MTLPDKSISDKKFRQCVGTIYRQYAPIEDKQTYDEVRDIIVRCTANKTWALEFTYRQTASYTLSLRRGGTRTFKRLNGAYEFLKKAGVKSFTVKI